MEPRDNAYQNASVLLDRTRSPPGSSTDEARGNLRILLKEVLL